MRMDRHRLRRLGIAGPILLLVLLGAAGCAGVLDRVKERAVRKPAGRALDAATVAAGLREALAQGTAMAVAELGRENGFWSHPVLRIPIPENLHGVERGLRRIGQGRLADEFARTLNRAAERATPRARGIFLDAIRQMTIEDAFGILRGPADAATQYFRRTTEQRLAAAFRPLVAQATEASGATAAYKRLVRVAAPLGLADSGRWDLDEYVTQQALVALFRLVADEERRIRADPLARTSELLRQVFR